MKRKIKHNKKRNTAFLYEVLVREITKSIITKDLQKKNIIIGKSELEITDDVLKMLDNSLNTVDLN